MEWYWWINYSYTLTSEAAYPSSSYVVSDAEATLCRWVGSPYTGLLLCLILVLLECQNHLGTSIRTRKIRNSFIPYCLSYELCALYKLLSQTLHIGLTVFTVRLHVMQRTVLLSQFCLSVRPSVCPSVYPSDACIVTKLNNALRIFWYHTKRQSL